MPATLCVCESDQATAGDKPSHVCFAHATATDRLDKTQLGRFAECVVGHASGECCASVCA